MRVAVIVPVCNAEKWLPQFLSALQMQRPTPDTVLFIDSASDDNTVSLLRNEEFPVHCITRCEFNHGGTRRLGSELVGADVCVYLTQDAILHSPDAIEKLVAPFAEDALIGVSYGRQLPHSNAGLIGAHARSFNYPAISHTRALTDAPIFGVKTCFTSDSFCAYRVSALKEIGGFPHCVIGTEDAHVAARLLLAGKKVHYAADSCVYHSHDYTLTKQFRRYFDIGVFYGREHWIRASFGSAGGEGLRFLASEVAYLMQHRAIRLLPYALLQNAAKILGYRLGKLERKLPMSLKMRISMNQNFWSQDSGS